MKFVIVNKNSQVYVGNKKWSDNKADAIRMKYNTAEIVKKYLSKINDTVLAVPVNWL